MDILKLSSKDIDFFKENGFFIYRNFLSKQECQKLKKDALGHAQDRIHNYLNFHRDIESFRELIVRPQLLDICDQLNDHRMVPIGSIYFFCKPGNPLENGSVAHQDNYAAQAPYGSYFVGSIALDDANESNGALVVYPKSHLVGELESTRTKNFEFDENNKLIKSYPIGNEVEVPNDLERLQLRYEAGDAIFLHSHIIHEAKKNTSHEGKWRNQIYLHYIKDGHPFWPGWNARRQIIDRGARRV